MVTLDVYLDNPCRALSIPYWKNKNISLPPYMKIVHDSEFCEDLLTQYKDERYFRLQHNLINIESHVPNGFSIKRATEKDVPIIADVINRSYSDLSVSEKQVQSFTKHPTFDGDLWVLVVDNTTSNIVGCGIAEFDKEASEGIIEWVQVLPEYRSQGLGKFIVNELLRSMKEKASFATVSGKVDNQTNPEILYRKCGFSGKDVWHILHER